MTTPITFVLHMETGSNLAGLNDGSGIQAALITGVSSLIGDGRFDDTEDMADMRIEGDLFS